ncbi:hypothetical protein K503DRAFT_778460 [Rhizopogon vinicolor AM-OR11-026]|uniref:Uncharacterized protein n=1 Tax=Rhizopogon vinicolor AM-OR11-026 TaxID=1314800 RepID=A0A1B7NHZ9_9AGAM|nr:hypothetical protein K503DRAFT_778460 [Rhizopogon vinicolor AM-OR11-026]
MTAGPVDLNVNFFSPIEPTELLKQSIPFSHLALPAVSNDGGSHSVRLYTGISAEWTTTTGNIVTQQVMLENNEFYIGYNDHIQQPFFRGSWLLLYSECFCLHSSETTYSAVLVRAQALDQMVQSDASANSSNYASAVMLSNVNSVIIPAQWPILLYSNPTPGKYLLLGLLEYQATGKYPQAAHDLDSTECGNIFMMALSYTQKSGDNSLITQYVRAHHDLFPHVYLVAEAFIPANQISTDDFAGAFANQTNLTIKEVIGIQVMSMISGLLGNTGNQQSYSSIVQRYVQEILTYAKSSDGRDSLMEKVIDDDLFE